MAAFLASVLIWLMFAAVFVLWLYQKKLDKKEVIFILLSSLFAWGISELLKTFIPSVRPYLVTGYSPLTLTIPHGSAFPSSHAAGAFALATGLWLHNKKLGYIFIVAAIGVSLGRIISNVHYIFDVIFGAWLGIVVAYLISKLPFLKNKHNS